VSQLLGYVWSLASFHWVLLCLQPARLETAMTEQPGHQMCEQMGFKTQAQVTALLLLWCCRCFAQAIIAHLVHYRAEGGPAVSSALSRWEHLKVYRMSGTLLPQITQHNLFRTALRHSTCTTSSDIMAFHDTAGILHSMQPPHDLSYTALAAQQSDDTACRTLRIQH
jgi:hypothetical protein